MAMDLSIQREKDDHVVLKKLARNTCFALLRGFAVYFVFKNIAGYFTFTDAGRIDLLRENIFYIFRVLLL